MKNFAPSTLLCDFYKTSHKQAYPQGTTKIYSTFTPRTNKYMPMANGAVVFGIQAFVQKYLVEHFNENFFGRTLEEVVAEYERTIKFALGVENPDTSHIADLHKLGYLPIELRALKEGTVAPIQVPVLTIENTVDEFYWVTNYFETILSSEIWLPMTSATFAHEMRKMLDGYAMKTVGHTNDVPFQAHDFSFRGMSSLESAMSSGAGHLLSFVGTDTIPAIHYLEHFYGANLEKELVGTSIPATEHSVMTALTPTDSDRNEKKAYKHLITEVFPNGLVSLVSDSYDFWKVIGETLPELKEDIMKRDGKVVIRPDSGNPVDILCGIPFLETDREEFWKSRIYAHSLIEESLNSGEKKYDEIFLPNSTHAFSEEEILKRWNEKLEWLVIEDEEEIYELEEVVASFHFLVGRETVTYISNIIVLGELDGTISYHVTDSATVYNNSDMYGISYRVCPSMSELKGLIECLWETFGGTVSEQGYKVLDSHIGAIYGDSITYERAKEICERLIEKGFASTNVVFGVGSYSYQHKTRDTLGFAMKATYAEIDGKPVMLQKDPKTDSGKKSQRGKVSVEYGMHTDKLTCIDGLSNTENDKEVLSHSLLEPVFKDGKVLRTQTLSEIREILNK